MRFGLMAAAAACVVAAPASAGTIVRTFHFENGPLNSSSLLGFVPRGGRDLTGISLAYTVTVNSFVSVEYFGDGGDDVEYTYSGVYTALPMANVEIAGENVQLSFSPSYTSAYSGTFPGNRSGNYGTFFTYTQSAAFSTVDPAFLANVAYENPAAVNLYQYNDYDLTFFTDAPRQRIDIVSYPTSNVQDVTITYTFAGEVPEPATWALMILGFGAVGGAMRRRQPAPRQATAS